VDSAGYIVGTHVQKTMMAAWRWDKTREPVLRSPVKEEMTVLKMFGSSQRDDQMLACATKKGKILVYQLSSGVILAEIENAHYMEIVDLAVSEETGASAVNSGAQMLMTGGKDTKVKVWLLPDILYPQRVQGYVAGEQPQAMS